MASFDHRTFGSAARALLREAEKLATDAHMANVYASDTINGEGQADFDLLQAAKCLELAARDCRLLHAKVKAMRTDLTTPSPVE